MAKKLSSVLKIFDWNLAEKNQITMTPLQMCLNLKYGQNRPKKDQVDQNEPQVLVQKLPPVDWKKEIGMP